MKKCCAASSGKSAVKCKENFGILKIRSKFILEPSHQVSLFRAHIKGGWLEHCKHTSCGSVGFILFPYSYHVGLCFIMVDV